MITQERLKQFMMYDERTGIFTRIAAPRTRPDRLGTVASRRRANGYETVTVDGEQWLAHRLAWLYMTGEVSPQHIDHVDGNPSNNKWVNLRACNPSENQANAVARKRSVSGLKGVTYCKMTGRWRAKIKKNYRTHHLGRFDTIDEARLAYERAAKAMFGDFARVE